MQTNHSQPWWKFGLVWMVIAGPAIVVVACFYTLYLAITIPDPVEQDYYHQGVETSRPPAVVGAGPKATLSAKP